MEAAAMLRESRLLVGLSQRTLADRAGMPQATVSRIESGAVVPRVDTLTRLLAVCGCTLEAVPRPGAGLDIPLIRETLALTPTERLRRAPEEGRNLGRLLPNVLIPVKDVAAGGSSRSDRATGLS